MYVSFLIDFFNICLLEPYFYEYTKVFYLVQKHNLKKPQIQYSI